MGGQTPKAQQSTRIDTALSQVDTTPTIAVVNNSVTTTVEAEPDKSVWFEGRNGGRLRRGNPGNRGGTGRPPGAVKSESRRIYERVLRQLDAILDEAEDGNPLALEDLVTVGNMAGRYAGLTDDKASLSINVASLHVDALRQPRVTATIAQPVAALADGNVSDDADDIS